MENMKNDTTPKWKEMAQQLKVDCEKFDTIEYCKARITAEEYKAIPILEKIDGELNAALDRRDKAFRALVMELTDLGETGADELIEQVTQRMTYLDLTDGMVRCSEAPIVKYGFGWWFNFDTYVETRPLQSSDDFDDDLPF